MPYRRTKLLDYIIRILNVGTKMIKFKKLGSVEQTHLYTHILDYTQLFQIQRISYANKRRFYSPTYFRFHFPALQYLIHGQ